jgi:hypothetical protein
MKKTLLSIFSMSLFVVGATAQTYTPSEGSPLAGGEVGTMYAGQTINADIPTTLTLTGQDILNALPDQAQALGAFIDGSTSYTVDVTSTVLTVEGLPAGLTSDCNGCTVNAGSDRDIVISGTPTAGGMFTVNVASETAGETEVDIPFLGATTLPFGGTFSPPGVPVPIPVPAIPGIMNADGYTMNIAGGGNSISESNDVFSLKFYPNPTVGEATLDVNSLEPGVARVEVYSITGSLVATFSESIRVGVNRVSVDMNSIPSGIYLIKADINGAQALIRTQKI